MENIIKSLEARIAQLEADLSWERAERAIIVDQLEQCVAFATGIKKQRDEAVKLTEQLIEAAQKHEKKIVLPDHLASDGKPKIII